MMKKADTNRERLFGITVGAVCCILWVATAWRGRGNWVWLAVLGGTLMLLGWVAPVWLRLQSMLWWKLSEALGWINSRIILTLVFFFVFTPVGLAMRLFGRDSLRLRRAARLTGWEPYSARVHSTAHYEKMF